MVQYKISRVELLNKILKHKVYTAVEAKEIVAAIFSFLALHASGQSEISNSSSVNLNYSDTMFIKTLCDDVNFARRFKKIMIGVEKPEPPSIETKAMINDIKAELFEQNYDASAFKYTLFFSQYIMKAPVGLNSYVIFRSDLDKQKSFVLSDSDNKLSLFAQPLPSRKDDKKSALDRVYKDSNSSVFTNEHLEPVPAEFRKKVLEGNSIDEDSISSASLRDYKLRTEPISSTSQRSVTTDTSLREKERNSVKIITKKDSINRSKNIGDDYPILSLIKGRSN